MKIKTCEYISASDIVPRSWKKWFWQEISENAPFSWGDNNKSMVSARIFANHCEDVMEDSESVRRFIEKVRGLGDMLIDLES